MKAGYKTTEFWLTLLAMILGTLMSVGVFPEGGLAIQVIGGAMAILSKLGYTASRASAKKNDLVASTAKSVAAATTTASPQ